MRGRGRRAAARRPSAAATGAFFPAPLGRLCGSADVLLGDRFRRTPFFAAIVFRALPAPAPSGSAAPSSTRRRVRPLRRPSSSERGCRGGSACAGHARAEERCCWGHGRAFAPGHLNVRGDGAPKMCWASVSSGGNHAFGPRDVPGRSPGSGVKSLHGQSLLRLRTPPTHLAPRPPGRRALSVLFFPIGARAPKKRDRAQSHGGAGCNGGAGCHGGCQGCHRAASQGGGAFSEQWPLKPCIRGGGGGGGHGTCGEVFVGGGGTHCCG